MNPVRTSKPGPTFNTYVAMVIGTLGALIAAVPAAAGTDAEIVAALDTKYQAAVERNDADTMAGILADDFVLVLGNGTVYGKKDLLDEARAKSIVWEKQVEIDDSQKVHVWGDTAVVTAKLWIKGTKDGKGFDRKLWFSDT
ncbi:MAG: nuclear transport factor 2 family protein, partial [Thermoanaerobaculia bacterium]|nr:nuclear transport factor 2 family protein [Thermoanaerobaculia bacterium]